MDAEGVRIGAGVSYDTFQATLDAEFPHLADYWRRIGGWQVRAMGTVGGNIANGSPIGDMPPALIALGATVTLRKGAERRDAAARGLLHRLRQAGPPPGEFVEEHLRAAARGRAALNAAYKLTKRRDQDISAVAGGFQVDGRRTASVAGAGIAFGGMAATPKRAARREAALIGKPWTLETVGRGRGGAGEDFTPLTDMRASADYRLTVARNLLRRFYLESRPARRSALTARGGRLMDTKLERPRSAAASTSPQRHDSAHKHVTGAADYIDDIAEPAGTLHAYLGLAERAHAEIVSIDLDAVRAAPGVVGVLTADGHSRRQRRQPGRPARRPDLRRRARSSSTASRCSPSSPRPATRPARAATLAKVEYRDAAACHRRRRGDRGRLPAA